MKKEVAVLMREGFWTGMGQAAAYSLIGLGTGLIVLALLPDSLPCPPLKSAAPAEKKAGGCGCGCGGR